MIYDDGPRYHRAALDEKRKRLFDIEFSVIQETTEVVSRLELLE